MNTVSMTVWVAFNVSVVVLLCLDAFVFNPKHCEMSLRRALITTAFWIALALGFNLWIYSWMGQDRALEFLAAYVVEQSLSVDNLFVFLLIFAYFKTPPTQQRSILFWGIISAQVMRAVFIISGITLMEKFHWMIYIFGAVLIWTGFKLFSEKDKEFDPDGNFFFRAIRKYVSLFWFVFIIVQVTDLVFAVDSIPAVLAITKDPFIAYTSNIFAVLGLRSMYFALASFMKMFYYLHYGLGIILIFVGLKMVSEHFIHIPIVLALGFIIVTLTISVVVSILCPPKSSKS